MIAPSTLSDLLAGLNAVNALLVTNPVSCKVGLISAMFNPSIDLVMGDLAICQLTGLVPLAGVAGPQNEAIDADTGESLVDVKVPAGGFRWETPGDFVGLVVVYGFALGNNAFDVLYGTHLLQEPILLTAANEAITAPRLQFPTNVVPTREFLTQARVHEAWMPTVWGWVEGPPPDDSEVPCLNFHLKGIDGIGTTTNLLTYPPELNSQADIDLATALVGLPGLVFPSPESTNIFLDGEEDQLSCWSSLRHRWEYTRSPS